MSRKLGIATHWFVIIVLFVMTFGWIVKDWHDLLVINDNGTSVYQDQMPKVRRDIEQLKEGQDVICHKLDEITTTVHECLTKE